MPMRVLCEKCTAAYTLPDARLVPGRLVQFTCRHCHERITVAVPASGAATTASPAPVAAAVPAPSPAPAPAAKSAPASSDDEDGVVWFLAGKDSQPERRSGAEIAAAIAARTVRSQTLLWRKGMAEWQPAGALTEWQTALRDAAGSGTSRGVAAQMGAAAAHAGQKPAWTMRSTDDPNSDSAQVAMKLPTLWVATEAPETRSPAAQKSAALTVRPAPQSRPMLGGGPDTTEDAAFSPEPQAGTAHKTKGPESGWTQWADPSDPADQTPVEPVHTPDASDWRRVALAALGMALVALIVSGVLAWRLHSVSSQMVTLRALPGATTAPAAPAAAPTEP